MSLNDALRGIVTRLRLGRLGTVVAASAAFVVLAIFAISALWIRSAIEANVSTQQTLRAAQVYRARVLRLQLDEETGVRGYVVTGAKVFLDPFFAARKQFDPTVNSLRMTLRRLRVDDTDVRSQVTLNTEWLTRVAVPSLRNTNGANQLKTELLGKSLIDRFRNLDEHLFTSLADRALQSEQAESKFVSRILWGAMLIGLISALGLFWFAVVRNRLARELEEQRRAFEQEKRLADALQEAFLRTELPQLATADLHAVYVPAGLEAKVGGDWYDAFQLPDNCILFSIGDVAGHGVEAAVVMSRVRQAIVSVGINERDPAIVLARANDILLLQDATMVTAVCGFIDLAQETVTYATAGHPPVLLLRSDGNVDRLPAGGPPLGAIDDARYESQGTAVQPGSMLVLYTDGLVEFNRDWTDGERKLEAAVRAIDIAACSDPAAQIMQSVFEGEVPQDDVAILTVTFRNAESPNGPVRADMTSSAVRPISDSSIRSLLASVVPQVYAQAALVQLERPLVRRTTGRIGE